MKNYFTKILFIFCGFLASCYAYGSSKELTESLIQISRNNQSAPRMLKECFNDGGCMNGFFFSEKECITQYILCLKPKFTKKILDLYNYEGAMHGFTKENKIKIIRMYADSKQFFVHYNLLEKFDKGEELEKFFENTKIEIMEYMLMDPFTNKPLSIQIFQSKKRTTRQLHLTDMGKIYYPRCVRAMEELALAESELTANQLDPQGSLRIVTTVAGGHNLLVPFLPEFILLEVAP